MNLIDMFHYYVLKRRYKRVAAYKDNGVYRYSFTWDIEEQTIYPCYFVDYYRSVLYEDLQECSEIGRYY